MGWRYAGNIYRHKAVVVSLIRLLRMYVKDEAVQNIQLCPFV